MTANWGLLLGFVLALRVQASFDGQAQTPFSVSEPFRSHKVFQPDVEDFLRHIIKEHNVPGMSVAVVHTDWTADSDTEFGNFGVKSEDGDAMTSDTLFTIASCSKAFLSAGMGILIDDFENGRNLTALPPSLSALSWHTKLSALLPGEWKLMDSLAERSASLKDILSHTSGLPRHDFSYARNDTAASILARLHELRPAFELRERYSYNNIMYTIGAHILDIYTGIGMERFMHDRIFAPLNTTFTYSPDEAHKTGRTTQTWSKEGRAIPWWFNEDDYEFIAGAGGVIADADGLARWVKVFLHEGRDPATNRTIIPEKTFKMATTARTVQEDSGSDTESISGYGLGWMRASYRGHEIVSHGGSVPGISTLVMFAPHDNVGLVILTNGEKKHEANKIIAWRLFEAAFGLAPSTTTRSGSILHSGTKRPIATAEMNEPLPAADLTGTYSALGYGAGFELCSITSTSPTCARTLADFATVAAASGRSLKAADLYAHWPRIWGNNLELAHISGTRYAFRPTSLFPSGHGKNKAAFQVSEEGDLGEGEAPWADFVIENGRVVGFGLSGTVGEQTMLEREGGSVKQTADAWFVRE